jgi:hypothetical protein
MMPVYTNSMDVLATTAPKVAADAWWATMALMPRGLDLDRWPQPLPVVWPEDEPDEDLIEDVD